MPRRPHKESIFVALGLIQFEKTSMDHSPVNIVCVSVYPEEEELLILHVLLFERGCVVSIVCLVHPYIDYCS